MARLGKKLSIKATTELNALLSKYGTLNGDRFIIKTKFGVLNATVDCSADSEVLTVFTRFDKVCNILRCSQVQDCTGMIDVNTVNDILPVRLVGASGKMNFHVLNLKGELDSLKESITTILNLLQPKTAKVVVQVNDQFSVVDIYTDHVILKDYDLSIDAEYEARDHGYEIID